MVKTAADARAENTATADANVQCEDKREYMVYSGLLWPALAYRLGLRMTAAYNPHRANKCANDRLASGEASIRANIILS